MAAGSRGPSANGANLEVASARRPADSGQTWTDLRWILMRFLLLLRRKCNDGFVLVIFLDAQGTMSA